ncbi:MAG: ATP-binding cassette subfamily B bacterial MsbA [Candidatus Saganbacteria bacterium]|uniref:ATP-binding cassette subfamily B bacterial MsbA n=1 Tax=Candidatus Saganbacteria bacterium TaxID=2575572 RepID=A0A833P2N7_UNCSA|nr:MAG: ATP-binding cassette subfamily B bacterial MsbA [Candidatus Saganbacteria bacterium]
MQNRLIAYLMPYKKQITGAFICMIIMSLANILLIPLIGKLSEAVGAKSFVMLNIVVLAAIGLYFLRGLATYGQGYLTSFVGHRLVADLRINVFKHLQDLSLEFFAKWRTGEVISRITNDISIVQQAIMSSVMDILPSLVTLVGVMGYLIYLNWRLTLITLLVIPLLSWIIKKFGVEMHEVSRDAQRKAADITSILQETISGVRVIKAFATEKQEIKKFSEESEKSFWLSLKQSQINVTQTPLLAFLQMLAVALVIWYGSFEVVSGRLKAADLIAFFAGVAMIADPISRLGNINSTIQQALASAERIFEVIDIKPTIVENPNPIELLPIKGKVEFKNVSFKYEQNEKGILHNVNLSANPGEIIALVGRSGAGKSTLVNLIPRFYDPQDGDIFIDGLSLKDLKLETYRKQLGIIHQEIVLFSGTIRDNIAYAKVDALDEEVEMAAKSANAHDFILELPDGYNSMIGERGIRLSGGERQRIAIARALLMNPKILIFDEATSALDSESEQKVQEAMGRLMAGRTVFIIAHRLSTVQHATKIIVLDEGQIIEEGSHDALLNAGGLYKKLYDMQFKDE